MAAARLFRPPLSSMVQRPTSTSPLAARQGRHVRSNGSHATLLGLSIAFATVTTAAAALRPEGGLSTVRDRRYDTAHPKVRWALPFTQTLASRSQAGRWMFSTRTDEHSTTSFFRHRVAMCESATPQVTKEEQVSTQFDEAVGDAAFYYERIEPPHRSLTESHAIFGPLMGEDKIERYNVYRRVNLDPNHRKASAGDGEPVEVAVGDIQIGGSLNGHDGIVHGGIISLLFDDAMGWGYEALLMSDDSMDRKATIVTANLNINFRNPLKEKTRAVIRIFYERTVGRKVYFKARMESQDGAVLYSDATSLFVTLKKSPPLKKRVTES